MTVHALYVDVERGPYVDLIGAENCWGLERNAKLYDGPGPVIAHPPCGPWGKLRWNCRLQDPECGPRAVDQVREFGGVLEHPAGSLLWKECGLPLPFASIPGLVSREWAISIDQCDWGFPARKSTWLFFVGVDPRSLPPMPPPGVPTMTIGTAREARKGKTCLPKTMRHVTTPALARWLLESIR